MENYLNRLIPIKMMLIWRTCGLKKRIWIRVTVVAILFCLIGAGIYGYIFFQSLSNVVNTMHEPLKREISEKRVEEITFEIQEPLSVLLLGVDEREGDRGRSDTMVVLTVNPRLESIKMISIPRDTRTTIAGHGTVDKINHAYAFGGVEMSIATVEEYFNIPVDYYLQINMEGFIDIINAIGGVTVNNDLDFTVGGFHFPEGEITLDGEEALLFSQMRYEDPRGDFGRQYRQRQIIQAVMKEGASISSLTNYKDIFQVLEQNVRTNLSFKEMMNIQKNYKTAVKSVEQIQLSGNGEIINSVYYYIVPETEQQRIQRELQKHLELVPGT